MPKNIDGYIRKFPKSTQKILRQFRSAVKNAAPAATETLAYGMAAFKLGKGLAYFAGWKDHVGFYPGPRAIEKFKKELRSYKVSKGTVQFELGEKLPVNLIKKMVQHRVKELVGELEDLPKPVLAALVHAKVTSLAQLTKWTEARLLKTHGIGPKGVRMLKTKMKKKNLKLKNQS